MKPKIKRKIMDNLSFVSHDLGFAGFFLENLRFFGPASAGFQEVKKTFRVLWNWWESLPYVYGGCRWVPSVSKNMFSLGEAMIFSILGPVSEPKFCCLTVMNLSDLDSNLPWDGWMNHHESLSKEGSQTV